MFFQRSNGTDPRTQLQARLDSERLGQQSSDSCFDETGGVADSSTTIPGTGASDRTDRTDRTDSTRSWSAPRPIFGGRGSSSGTGGSSTNSASKLRLVR